MLFSLHDLELRKIEFAENYAPGVIDLGPEAVQKTPLTATGRAELLEEHHGGKQVVKDIRVVGKFATQIEFDAPAVSNRSHRICPVTLTCYIGR